MTEYSGTHYIRQALTQPDFDVMGWVDDVFAGLEDENGVLHIYNTELTTVTHVTANMITSDRIWI